MIDKLQRYSMEHDWGGCYYEGDTPSIVAEVDDYGEWVKVSDLIAFLADLRKQFGVE